MSINDKLDMFVFDLRLEYEKGWFAENLVNQTIKVNPDNYRQIEDIKINGKKVYLRMDKKLEYGI